MLTNFFNPKSIAVVGASANREKLGYSILKNILDYEYKGKVFPVNLKGEKVEDIKLPEAVFNLPSNNSLLHQVYVSMMSNKRQVIAHTKDRAERAGSGRKPWKQKGTGRARTGSVRNPIWRKGGIVFGPSKERNFKKRINQKMKQKSIKIQVWLC